MVKAIRIHETGGPEVLKWEDVTVGDPGPGEIRVRTAAVGLNFIDVYFRTGLYAGPDLPLTLGFEGSGTVDAVGDGVADIGVGDRVAYVNPIGSYTQARIMPADRAVVLPDSIDFETAAAMMLKGLTAHYLLRRTYRVQSGDTVLIHAAAGGVGLIACQWAKALGATVIGTVGSDEKAEQARAHGCDHPIVYSRENFTDRVREITDGKGVPVVYDSIGKSTFEGSIDCLSPLGMMVSFGNATGPVPPIDPALLATKGALFFTRPTLFAYVGPRADLLSAAGELFDVVGSGKVRIEVNQRWPLAEAAEAHRALEARKTTGSTILTV
ncbi:MAG: quinone oxidoreductase [Sphingomonadales bacterium]